MLSGVWGRLARIHQPWLFIVLAVGFGVIAYFASGENLASGAVGGLVFGLLISAWIRVRERLWRS